MYIYVYESRASSLSLSLSLAFISARAARAPGCIVSRRRRRKKVGSRAFIFELSRFFSNARGRVLRRGSF